jgi:enoyl-[acyl-carrier protein] reductase II
LGLSAGGVLEVKPVAGIVADIMRDAEAAIDRMAGLKSKATA